MFMKGDQIQLTQDFRLCTEYNAHYAVDQLSNRFTEVFEVNHNQRNPTWVSINSTEGESIYNSFNPDQFLAPIGLSNTIIFPRF